MAARNVATNATAKAVTGANGAYTFESLVAGEYEVSCLQQDFSKWVGSGVRVSSQVATTLNIKLTIGSTTSEVRVTSEATQVEVSTPSLQTTLGTQSLMSLPVQGRNLLTAAQMMQSGAVIINNGRGNNVSFNGGRGNSVSYKVDGGDVNNYFNGMQSENTTFPQAENLEEFSVLTSTNEAKYGNTSGAQVIATVKSGTNNLHGAGWGYLQNQGWAANEWAANRDGVPRTPGSQKWFGGNVGGPVYIPKLYNGKNKTFFFFFFSYEYTNPSQFGSRTMHVPTTAERNGNFTNSLFGVPTVDGVPTPIFDSAQYSPLAKAIMPLLPQGDDANGGRFTWNYTTQLKTNAYVFKGDQMFGDKHRISGSLTRNFQDPNSNDFSTCCGGFENLPGPSGLGNPHHITSMFFNYVYIISPTMVNTLSVGGSHTNVSVVRNSIKDITWAKLGVTGVKLDKGAVDTDVNLWVATWAGGFSVFNGYFDGRTSDTTNVQDDFVWMKGRHSFEMGYQQRYQAQTKVGSWGAGGQVGYFGSGAGSTGNAFADFLLDRGGAFNQASGEGVDRRYPSQSAYFQDRFKINRKLTLMAGVRWDPHQGISELQNKWSVYRPGQQSTVYPGAPLGLLYYGDAGIGKAGYDNKWNNFNPRLGFAYDLTGKGKLALRGAYGMYSDFCRRSRPHRANSLTAIFSIRPMAAGNWNSWWMAARWTRTPSSHRRAGLRRPGARPYILRRQDRQAYTPGALELALHGILHGQPNQLLGPRRTVFPGRTGELALGETVQTRRSFLGNVALLGAAVRRSGAGQAREDLDPHGRIHIPIGIPDTLDTLKTFVEAEGGFSPGFGTYGVYFWVYDRVGNRLLASTMDGVPCRHGLHKDGFLIPWIEWTAGPVSLRLEICHVQRRVKDGKAHVVAARIQLSNTDERRRQFTLYASIRPLGPAGFDIDEMAVSGVDALLVGGRPALVGAQRATHSGVVDQDAIGNLAMSGLRPAGVHVKSAAGSCSGALMYDVELMPGEAREYSFVCPVLPGRRAARHQWADLGQEAMVDVAPLYGANGLLQPNPGLDYYRTLSVPELFKQAEASWRDLTGRIEISVPDARWQAAARAILGHASLCMNEGAPDVAAVNYNVFNRDGCYVANIFQKSGQFLLAEAALNYFLANPFNGRAYPEADNPGQILWALGQQWLFTRDRNWVARIYPSAAKIAAMIEYYRTTPGPHWVNARSLEFGDALPVELRSELKPGRCDGQHPEYTEAFDIAGLRAAAMLAGEAGRLAEVGKWAALAERLLANYRDRFGSKLTREYGSYAVLWPCELYPYSSSEARAQFAQIGARKPESWRYFPLATAHQGLLAGNREAGYGTLALHLEHEQMRGWFAFDEGGGSDSGGWHRARTTWPHNKEKPGENLSVAMPHGWAIAEFWLLLRDSLAHEDGDRLVLLPGVAPEWFRDPAGMSVTRLRTQFGDFGFEYRPGAESAVLRLTDAARPPGGFTLRLPPGLATSVRADGRDSVSRGEGLWDLPPSALEVTIAFAF